MTPERGSPPMLRRMIAAGVTSFRAPVAAEKKNPGLVWDFRGGLFQQPTSLGDICAQDEKPDVLEPVSPQLMGEIRRDFEGRL